MSKSAPTPCQCGLFHDVFVELGIGKVETDTGVHTVAECHAVAVLGPPNTAALRRTWKACADRDKNDAGKPARDRYTTVVGAADTLVETRTPAEGVIGDLEWVALVTAVVKAADTLVEVWTPSEGEEITDPEWVALVATLDALPKQGDRA